MTILIIAEHDNQILKPATYNTIAAAQQIGADIHILVAGFNATAVTQQATQIAGVTKVLYANDPCLEHALAENMAAQILTIAASYTHILFAATANGKNVAPRVAAKLDVAQISEITKIITPDTFERLIYAGNVLATVQSSDAIKVITVRTTAFPFEQALQSAGTATVETINAVQDSGKSKFVSSEMLQSERPELTSARVVIAGGRAFGSLEQFNSMLFPLADKLDAALGATRSAIDAGYAPNDWQLGQTGKVIAPELYIAAAISGAIQHTAGIKDSKIIVAINKDPEAPIFAVADYGLVGDIFVILPELTKAL